jgi:hypothetical protein
MGKTTLEPTADLNAIVAAKAGRARAEGTTDWCIRAALIDGASIVAWRCHFTY